MVAIYDIFTFIICLIFTLKSLKRIIKSNFSLVHIFIIVFFIIQVLPIIIGYFGDLSGIKKYYEYMYLAMTNKKVSYIYDLFCLSTTIILYYFANILTKKNNKLLSINFINSNNFKFFKIILIICTIFPLIASILFSPNPFIYFNFSYFNTHSISKISDIYIYHNNIVLTACKISFFSIIALYFFSNSHRKSWFVVPILLLTWINGKRTLLVFILMAIIVIDFIKADKQNKTQIKHIFYKIILYLILIVSYYIYYNAVTHKANFADSFLLYSIYFSRLSNVKIAIYDKIYTNTLLDYSFQTFIYDLLFYIPRFLWNNKPYPYYKYFTSYVFFGVNNVDVNMGFQVNIWSEFISNVGIIGWLISLYLIIDIAKKCEKSNNSLIYLSGGIFIVLYMAYGFEHVVQITFLLYNLLLFINFVKKHYKH